MSASCPDCHVPKKPAAEPPAALRVALSLRYALDALDTADKALRSEIEAGRGKAGTAALRRRARLLEKARELSRQAADHVARAMEDE